MKSNFDSQQYTLAVARSTAKSKVFQAIRAQGARGATCEEIETYLQMRHQTVSARIFDLVDANVVYDTLMKRKTSSGKLARVLRAFSLRDLKSRGLLNLFCDGAH